MSPRLAFGAAAAAPPAMLYAHQELLRIEDSLKEKGVPIRQLCREAKVAPSTWTRWKSAKTSPTLGTLQRCQQAAEALLARAAA